MAKENIGPLVLDSPSSEESMQELKQRYDKSLHELRVHQEELHTQNEELRNAQAELSRAKQKFQTLFELMPVGYAVLDEHGVILEVNHCFTEFLGAPRNKIVQKSVIPFFEAQDQRLLPSSLKKAAQGQAVTVNGRIPHPDTSRMMELQFSPFEDYHDGREPLVNLIVLDITDKNRAETCLRESEERFRRTIEQAPYGVCILNKDGRVEYVNPAVCDIFVVDCTDLLGVKFSSLLKYQEQESFQKRFSYFYNKQGELHDEFKAVRRNGLEFDIFASSALFVGPDNKPRAALFIQDISERKRAEQEIFARQEQYRALFENNHSVMLLINPETGEIIDANAAACSFYGYSHKQLVTMRIYDINPMAKSALRSEMGLAVKEEKNTFDFQHRLADGSYRNVDVHSGPITVHGKQLLYSVIHDVTEKRKLEQAREDVERIMRHDLKSPLNSIIGIPHMLLEEGGLSDEQVMLIEAMQIAGYRMLNQVNSSLELHKIETGMFRFIPNRVDLVELFHHLLREMDDKASAREVLIEAFGNGLPLATAESVFSPADEMLSYSMFSNIVMNALEASPPGGVVRIDITTKDDVVSIQVHNQTPVPHAMREVFFDKYTTCDKPHGTGLGTYSAKLMAEAQEGSISFTTSEEAGTTVEVTFRSDSPQESGA